jgi:MoaA/NifB/PqqE/SkfB family radical SAM enzyme
MSADPGNLQGFQLRIHGMPCVNECSHCHSFGKPGSAMMNFEEITGILEQAAELKRHLPMIALFYRYEPTVHPQFLEIFEKQSELGLLWDDYFFSSNCFGLARLDDTGWKRLKDAGMDHIQMVFHGQGWDHDATVGRRRAYIDLLRTIEKAEEHDIKWDAGVMVRSEIVHKVPAIIDAIRKHGRKSPDVDCYVFNWLGRGAADEMRPVEKDLEKIPLDPEKWRSERQCVEDILASSELSNYQVSEQLFNHVLMEVFSDRKVYCAGGCDSVPPLEFLPFLELGTLDEKGLLPFAEGYARELPLPMKLLRGLTWGELAERYGDRDNEHLYHLMSISGQKWATLYLREKLPS